MINDDSLCAALIVATEQLLARAEQQWGLPASWRQLLQISCCLRGRAAGKVEVHWRGGQPLRVRLRLNLAAARLDWRQMGVSQEVVGARQQHGHGAAGLHGRDAFGTQVFDVVAR